VSTDPGELPEPLSPAWTRFLGGPNPDVAANSQGPEHLPVPRTRPPLEPAVESEHLRQLRARAYVLYGLRRGWRPSSLVTATPPPKNGVTPMPRSPDRPQIGYFDAHPARDAYANGGTDEPPPTPAVPTHRTCTPAPEPQDGTGKS
jgi:hypothetical protein